MYTFLADCKRVYVLIYSIALSFLLLSSHWLHF